ncbi:MAG: hypothetical protein U0176_06210 [Bacteroidia bacterium]
MNNRHLLAFCFMALLLLFQSCGSDVAFLGKSELDFRSTMDLRGPVIEVTELTFDLERPVFPTGRDTATRELWRFDTLGHLIEKVEWRSGLLYYRAVSELNAHFQDVSYTTYMGPEQSLQGQTTTDYLPNGQIREQQYFNKDRLLQRRTIYEYDDRNRLVLEKTTHYESESEDEMRYTYIDTTREIATRTLIMDGYTYLEHYKDGKAYMTTNEYGEIIQQSKYNAASGDLTSTVSLGGDTVEYMALFTRDAAGRIIRQATYNGQAILTRWEVTSYDSLGNVLTECLANTQFDVKPLVPADTTHCLLSTYTYTYDALGNWTSCTKTENGKPISERKRILRYWYPEAEKPTR